MISTLFFQEGRALPSSGEVDAVQCLVPELSFVVFESNVGSLLLNSPWVSSVGA